MARTPSSQFITEKNKQTNRPLRLYTIHEYDGVNNLYFVENHENIRFLDQEYTAFPIRYETMGENTQGEVDGVKLILGNVSRLIRRYLTNYDWRLKKVTIRTIWGDYVDSYLEDVDGNEIKNTEGENIYVIRAEATMWIDDVFYIDSYSADSKNVNVTMTSKFDVVNLDLPSSRYGRNYCRWKFKSTECGYAGAESECNRTLARCRELDNQLRFGGFPSIPTRRLYIS